MEHRHTFSSLNLAGAQRITFGSLPETSFAYRIDEDDGLPGILVTLGKPFKKLKTTLLEPLPGTESYRIADAEMPVGWMRVRNSGACRTMPRKAHGLSISRLILQRTG